MTTFHITGSALVRESMKKLFEDLNWDSAEIEARNEARKLHKAKLDRRNAMQIHNTVLALQMMNGVKVYAIRFLNDGRTKTGKSLEYEDGAEFFADEKVTRPLSSKRYHYKSADPLAPGTWVVVPTNDGKRFGIGRVEEEVIDVDFDDGVKLLWINQTIDNPGQVYDAHAKHDTDARRKLAASQAMKAAEEHLKHLGVDASAFAIEDKSEEASK